MPKTIQTGLRAATFECERHGEYVANVVTIGEREHIGRCPECANEESSAEEQAARTERMRALFTQAEIPPRFHDRSFENFRVVNPKAMSALRMCRDYAQTFAERRRHGGGLVLCGKPGTGKTHLACATARMVIRRYLHKVLYTTVASAVRFVKQAYDRDARLSETEALKRFQRPELLILDEVGMQRGTEYEVMLIGEVINERYASVLPTMLISNHTPDALGDFIGPRAVDRMREGGGVTLVFEWESYRARVEADSDLTWPT